MSVEITIRNLAKSGRLNHLSIAFTSGQWEVSYRGVDHHDTKIVRHKDVIEALEAALKVRKPPKEEKDEGLLV